MNDQAGSEPRRSPGKPEAADDSGAQYLKSLCDRRDAAVRNPFLSREEVPDPGDAAATAATPNTTS